MPVLQTTAELQKIYLPSYNDLPEADRGWCVINVGEITTQDILKASSDNTEIELAVKMLVSRIVEWNLTDANGNTLDISFENVTLLKLEDYKHLAENMRQTPGGLDIDEKKDLNSTLAQSPTVAIPIS